MSLVLPHLESTAAHAGPQATKSTKGGKVGGLPALANELPKTSFQDHLKALVAGKSADKASASASERSSTEKTAAEKAHQQGRDSLKAHGLKAAADVQDRKVAVKPEPKKKETPTEQELSVAAALAQHLAAVPQVAHPKVAKQEPATELNPVVDKTKVPKSTVKTPGERGNPETGSPDAPRFDALVKTEPKKAEKDTGPKVTVVDKRSERDKARKTEQDQPTDAVPAVAQPVTVKPVGEVRPVNEIQVVFQSVSGKSSEKFETPAKSSPIPPQDAAAFQKFLVEKGYGQLVEQARIILKNDNAGEIRMTLYPETLGKIKVALNLNDNHLAGEIFVENQTVKEILQDNMGQMMQSFRDGGFGEMNIQVSVGNGQNRETRDPNERPGIQAASYGRNVASGSADESLASAARISNWTDKQVNLTA